MKIKVGDFKLKFKVDDVYKGYIAERVAGLVLIVFLFTTGLIINFCGTPPDRFFIERDPTLSNPKVDDTVPVWAVAIIGGVMPLVIIVSLQVWMRNASSNLEFEEKAKDIVLSMMVLSETIGVTFLATTVFKIYVGRLRPNFFAYCNYKGYRDALASGNFTEYMAATFADMPGNFDNCLDPTLDAHLSFPSGHSSVSFCGQTFLALFFLYATSRLKFHSDQASVVVRLTLIAVPMFIASLVAASRVKDYMHNVEDTIWGALLGLLAAFASFQANYKYPIPPQSTRSLSSARLSSYDATAASESHA